MAPKKNKKIKTKSKRYSCPICYEIDNARMIQCDYCEAKFHLKCVNIQALDENDEWMCFECLKKDLSRPPKSSSNDKSAQSLSKRTNDSTSKCSQSDRRSRSTEHKSNKSDTQDGASSVTQGEARKTQQSEKNSRTTNSSERRRIQLELERLEEERQLKEKRDKEYLDKKYSLLMEERDNISVGTRSERRSTDRSSYTKEWIQNQSVEVQPPSESRILPADEQIDDETSPQDFDEIIDSMTFDNTSPMNLQDKSLWIAQQSKRAAEARANPTHSQCQRIQPLSSTKANVMDRQNVTGQQRTLCSEHDARQFIRHPTQN